MKTDWTHLDKWRLLDPRSLHYSPEGSTFGAFMIPHPEKGHFKFEIIATDGKECRADLEPDWEHVSVKVRDVNGLTRLPGWAEMDYLKSLFWEESEVVVQYHINGPNKINLSPHVLHLWRHATLPFPTPPQIFV
jgi:hypothetical protein